MCNQRKVIVNQIFRKTNSLNVMYIICAEMAEKYPSNTENGDEGKEDNLGGDLAESFGSNSTGSDRLTSSSDSNSHPKRQRDTSPSRSPGRSESPSASYRMVPRKLKATSI